LTKQISENSRKT